MIPLRDNVPSATVPIVNYALIALNLGAFAYEISLPPRALEHFLLHESLVPVKFFYGLSHLPGGLGLTVLPLFVSMFLHGGWAHVLGNMLYLYIFGDNVEDRMGHARYLAFYLLVGCAAAAAQLVASPRSAVPMVGASGAIAGVMGAYFVLHPRARVLTLIPIFFFIQFVEVPAIFFLFFWFAMQFLSGTLALATVPGEAAGGVAWWAHIGGFAAGVLLVGFFRRSRRRPPASGGYFEA